jgi:anthranilate synthase/aminodeoxychorismate synthase-like glutamine amidotransferase
MHEQSESDAGRCRQSDEERRLRGSRTIEMKLLVIDNYDSFTYNLVQLFGEMDNVDLVVKRNDEISIDEIRKLKPDRICISPGPGRPEDAGISSDLIREFGQTIPILGVCLGHQCIAQVFGGEIVRADKLMHGKTSQIHHRDRGVFKDLAEPLEATRYHSLIVKPESLPDSLEITAETDAGEIMGLQHREFPIHGVQFHPESILTAEGRKLLANFLKL